MERAAEMDTVDDTRLDETFAAMANSTRRAMLMHLAHGELTVNELADPLDVTLPAVSKHLKVLERAGLVTRGRSAQYRPCRLDPAALDLVSTWAQECRATWEGRLDRMTDYLAELHETHEEGSRHAREERPRSP
jgi:DNA-binding transcriptional ArsR family regulator